MFPVLDAGPRDLEQRAKAAEQHVTAVEQRRAKAAEQHATAVEQTAAPSRVAIPRVCSTCEALLFQTPATASLSWIVVDLYNNDAKRGT